MHLRGDQRRSSIRSDKSPPTLDSYLALLHSYEAKKKYDVVSHSVFEIKANVIHSGTMFQLSRRCCLSSIRVPKIVSQRMANVCDGMRSLRNGGGTFENGYIEPMRTWKRSNKYFKSRSRHPVIADRVVPRQLPSQEVESRRKEPRRPSPHSESWRRKSSAHLNNFHPCRSRPLYPRSIGNRPQNRPVHYGQDLLSFSAARVRSRQLHTAQVTNIHKV